MSNQFVALGPSQIVEGRPFTNLEGSAADRATLQDMAETLCRLMLQPKAIPDQPRPLVLYLKEPGGHLHRIALSQPELLLKLDDLTVVGFCGHKRPEVDRGPIDALDEELIAKFPQYADLLSYSTLQMNDGDSCNLVVFSQPQGIGHWATSKIHARAVQMSPQYYETVRLHQGILPGGLMSAKKLVLLQTKYYDYRHQPMWRAIRKLREGE